MSTRSVIARPEGDGWKGRYCHSDGYPTWNGRALVEIVRRDGLEQATETLLAQHRWSVLSPDTVEDDGSDVAGYGVGWMDGDEWRTSEEPRPDNFDIEWVYVLVPAGLTVIDYSADVLVGTIPWDTGDLDAALQRAECGKDYERCSHYASAHFPELGGTDCARLGTGQYLGREPIGALSDAVGFIVRKGARDARGVPRDVVLRATSSGGLKLKAGQEHLGYHADLTNIWESSVQLGDREWRIPTWNVKADKPVAYVEPVFPDPKNPRTV